jgi:uncharacterized protein YkwD
MMTLYRVLRTARRTIVTSLVAASVAVGVAAGSTATAGHPAAGTATTRTPLTAVASSLKAFPAMGSSTYEQRTQYWINVRRHQHGLSSLRPASCADRFAERWGSHLASTDSFYHQSMTAILDTCKAHYAGETLGRGSISPKRLVYLWMHSPEHRAVLLSHYPRRIGIGAYPDSRGEWVVAADFMKF